MANIKEYIKHYKNVSFQDNPFNDIDSMLLTQIVYADFMGIVPSEKNRYILFSDAIRLFLKRRRITNPKKTPRFLVEVYNLLDDLKDANRYANMKIYFYKKIVDETKQFCACTFRFQNMTYISFEGTDSSIIGWKEDFLMTKTFPVEAQSLALRYLHDSINFFDNHVILGGHSKGGNLAMTAGMLAGIRVKNKIKTIYNFDGPGFREKEYQSSAFQKMTAKLKMFVPEDSTVGLLLWHSSEFTVVKSTGRGIWQHDPLTWECFGNIFILGNLTQRSANLESSNLSFIRSMNDEERGAFIEAFFSIFHRMGIIDTSQLLEPKLNQMLQVIKELYNFDAETKKRLITLIKMIYKGLE